MPSQTEDIRNHGASTPPGIHGKAGQPPALEWDASDAGTFYSFEHRGNPPLVRTRKKLGPPARPVQARLPREWAVPGLTVIFSGTLVGI